jgi:AraC family transcriptional regulator
MLELLHMQLAIEIGRSFDDIPLQACGGLAPWRLRAIDERINDAVPPPTLEELAMLVGLSVRQLTRGFRTSKGKSIGAFVEQKRIEQSKRLLQMNLPIKEVASRMGFSSPSGFAHSFKTATGETPRMFRGLHGASATPTAGRSRTAINSMVP